MVSYCGQYELQPGNIATISMENETLFAAAPGLDKTPMNTVSENEFDVKVVGARVTFLKGDSGKIAKMKVNMNGQEVFALRLPDFDPSKVSLSEYTGDFYSPELDTKYSLVVESGKLIARHFRTGDVNLTASKPDQFSGNQWYFGQVVFLKDSEGKIMGMKVSGGRTRNIKFDKN
jgi:hypothetical protein